MHYYGKTDKGIRIIMELARRYGGGYVSTRELAERCDTGKGHTEKLLLVLGHAGLTYALEGRYGGHVLARPPERITLAEVVLAMNGWLTTSGCEDHVALGDCVFTASCAVRGVWQRITAATTEILQGTTILELVEQERARELG